MEEKGAGRRLFQDWHSKGEGLQVNEPVTGRGPGLRL